MWVYVNCMAFDVALRRAHRVVAVLFLLAIPSAGYFSLRHRRRGFFCGLPPLFPLFGLILTGGYLLVRPCVSRLRAN